MRLIVYFQPQLQEGGGGLHIPCVGRMAVERCLGYFVILACSRGVWELIKKISFLSTSVSGSAYHLNMKRRTAGSLL